MAEGIELRDVLDSTGVDTETANATNRGKIDITGVNGLTDAGAGDKFLADNGTYVAVEAGGGTGDGDMLTSVYDTEENGVIDNSELVNGLTVETAVPSGALFTDTIYNNTGVTIMQDKLITNNGFDRYNMNTLGVVEFCKSSASGIVYQYQALPSFCLF